MTRSDVCIVGAGPVGALAALGLAQRGLSVVVLEEAAEIVPSPRAMVYYWHVLEGLDRLGVLDDMNEVGIRNRQFLQRVGTDGEQAVVSLDPVRAVSDHDYNLHLGQHEVVRIALNRLAQYDNATIIRGARVVDIENGEDRVIAHVEREGERESFVADRLLGADGARSVVRSSLGMAFDGTTWPDRFVATNLRYPFAELGGLGMANMLLDAEQGCVIAQIDATGLYRWTWSEPASLPEASVPERLPARLAALGFGDAPYQVEGLTPYRMHQRSADAMKAGRVLLAGDAAHATNPTGGYGLTCGLYDVFSLIDTLAGVITGARDEDELDRWAEERLRIFREHASPMASHIKHLVYDEPDTAVLRRFVATAADLSDTAAVLRRLTGMRVLASGLPVHHAELSGSASGNGRV
jgi:3-(3-hydroxy-phenyl)propionate hydroxylase/6-hydroxy-3-succinoylpyridine 3-monooxygenase